MNETLIENNNNINISNNNNISDNNSNINIINSDSVPTNDSFDNKKNNNNRSNNNKTNNKNHKRRNSLDRNIDEDDLDEENRGSGSNHHHQDEDDDDDEDDSKDASKMNDKKRSRPGSRASGILSRNPIQNGFVSSGIGKASFIHALVVIFLEFFAWGLLTDQVINVLNETFPSSTFLANGLIQGLKGLLSFLSAPLIGAMSDIWGRKVFLLITVFFTCLPIPLMRINAMWYFAMISISGLFAVTFSVVFAYVADVTDESNRATAYGLVSATFAASLITSPALGSYLSRFYSENFVVALATAIAIFDLFFILVAVPESLPEKLRERSKSINWENVDPFKSLKVIFADRTISLLCITVFLSYLPEAGQYSCFFVYLKLIVGFSQEQVAYFIAYVGILSCIAQAAILVILIRYFGSRESIIIGLSFQVMQLAMYGFAAQQWLIWFSGLLAAISSIGYPAISAYISNQSHVDQQGVSQGMVTGIRGLCNGIGPALYGFIFWIFSVSLNETGSSTDTDSDRINTSYASTHLLPGPPFLFGSVLALIAIFVTLLIPSSNRSSILLSSSTTMTKHNKDKTLVKIGNSSNSYNRTSSSSSIAPMVYNETNDLLLGGGANNVSAALSSNHNKPVVTSDLVYSSVDYNNIDESDYLLMSTDYDRDNQANALLSQLKPTHSSSSAAASVVPSFNNASNSLNVSSSNFINSHPTAPSGSLTGAGIVNPTFSSHEPSHTLKNLNKQQQSQNLIGGNASSSSSSSHNLNFNLLNSHHFEHDSSGVQSFPKPQQQQQHHSLANKIKLDTLLNNIGSSSNTSNNNLSLFGGSSTVKYFNLQNKQSLD